MSALDPGTLRKASERAETVNAPWASLSFAVCVLVPVAFWYAPLGLAPQTQHGLAIILFMVLAWMTQAMEFAIAGFVGCFLFWALKIVPFSQAFSGFADSTAWFLFAALLLGRIAG
jgi:di/tricarboxylate transporter